MSLQHQLIRLTILFLACKSASTLQHSCIGRTAIRKVVHRSPTIKSEVGILAQANEWLIRSPYESAFCVTAFKATLSDLLAQSRELKDAPIETTRESRVDLRAEEAESIWSQFVWRRTLAFLLYGGIYQGCAQYWIFNECFPIWFGQSDDLGTIAAKVLTDQFILTPFLCLPVAYLFKVSILPACVALGWQTVSSVRRLPSSNALFKTGLVVMLRTPNGTY